MDVLADAESATFGQFGIDFGKQRLYQLDESGTPIPIALGSRAFGILAFLVSHAGELVSKNEIMAAVWPGLAVEEANLTVQISALRRALGQQGPGYIQTIPGRGYRFVAEVTRNVGIPHDNARATPLPEPAPLPPVDRPHAWRASRHRRRIILAALAVLLVGVGAAGVGAAGVLTHVFRHQPPRLSVAVLPFATESETQTLTHLSGRLSENLTLDLSQLWTMSVTAPQATLRFRNQAFDASSVGRTLGVRYLVEGNLYAENERIVLHVDLVSGETGKELWTDQTDWPSSDAVTAQARMGSWLQFAIGNAVLGLEAARSAREHPNNPDATDLYLEGRALLSLPSTRLRLRTAQALLERAVQMDPNSYLAITALLNAIITNEVDLNDGVTEHDLKHAEQLMAKAEVIAPTAYSVLHEQGYLLRVEQRLPEAEATFEHVLSLYPHAYYAAFQLGICRLDNGQAAEAVPLFEDAVAASAGKGDLFSRYIRLGEALLFAGRYDEAVPWLRKAEIADPERPPHARAQPYLLAASALALGAHVDAARAEMAEAIAIFPYASSFSFWGTSTGTGAYAVQLDRVRQGLTQAGLQAHVAEDAPAAPTQPTDLPPQIAGLTPKEILGGHVIATEALTRLLRGSNVVVLDGEFGQLSIPGAVSLPWMSRGGAVTDDTQPEFARLLAKLTGGDKTRPIVTLALNAYQWPGYNLARRAAALGYRNVLWYRGGRDAWAAAGLPMDKPRPDPLMAFEELG
ncbi:winged helix-turn-helix domain-containing protein [Acidisphaera sp. S103]|uniref:winged helix-turn-helix domain-containing protein n=1 Tax=Acidisphaera sp. S103 TaxID=1747223 RepID=UPI00131C5980|nr:winged helix-turn-helix domain-containing protein [Acidisphaera sp. S103]